MQIIFKILDVDNDKKISEGDLFQIMKLTESHPLLFANQESIEDGKNERSEVDLFLEIFSNDFCRIIKTIEMKRNVRGRGDENIMKIRAIEQKLMSMSPPKIEVKKSMMTGNHDYLKIEN